MLSRFLAAALLLLAAALPARATVLFAGGEMVDFTCVAGGTCDAPNLTAGVFRATWAREAISLPGNSGNNDFFGADFAATTDIWVHHQFYSGAANTVGWRGIQVAKANTGATLSASVAVMGTGTTGQVKIVKINDAGTVTTLVTCTTGPFPTVNTLTQVDFHVNYAVAGEASLYINGEAAPYCTYSGDVTSNGYTTLSHLLLGCMSNNGGSPCLLSEVMVQTVDTRADGLRTLTTSGNGAAVAWTGTNICSAIWAATNYSDASFASTTTNNLTHQCTMADTLPAGTFSVPAVGMAFRGLVGAAGPQHVKFVTRLGGVDYLSADFAPTTAMSNCCMYIQATNPATAAAWATGDISGIQLGLKSTP